MGMNGLGKAKDLALLTLRLCEGCQGQLDQQGLR